MRSGFLDPDHPCAKSLSASSSSLHTFASAISGEFCGPLSISTSGAPPHRPNIKNATLGLGWYKDEGDPGWIRPRLFF